MSMSIHDGGGLGGGGCGVVWCLLERCLYEYGSNFGDKVHFKGGRQ